MVSIANTGLKRIFRNRDPLLDTSRPQVPRVSPNLEEFQDMKLVVQSSTTTMLLSYTQKTIIIMRAQHI